MGEDDNIFDSFGGGLSEVVVEPLPSAEVEVVQVGVASDFL